MSTQYEIQAGDCISSMAYRHGFFWETVWNDPANAELKERRGNPNVLKAGDLVVIPDLRPRQASCPTEKRSRFKLRGVPAKLRLSFLVEGEPRANQPYRLSIDGGPPQSGRLDTQGRMEHPLVPDAQRAEIWVGEPGHEVYYACGLGHLDPVDEDAGARQRLTNLGFLTDPETDDPEIVAESVRAFQRDQDLEPTGELTPAVCERLAEVHGS